MTATSTAAYAFKVGLEAAARAAIEAAEPGVGGVTFDWGEPDTWSDDNVLLMRTTSEQTVATMSTQRTRDETLTCELHIITRRTDQRGADDRAYELLGLIERYVRMEDPTLGGVALWCFLDGHDADGFTPGADMPDGRGCEIIATFGARARVSG